MMTNEVTKLDERKVSAEMFSGFEDTSIGDARDLIIPKILLMQGLSKMVTDEKALMGEMRDSLDNMLLGNKEKPVEFIPLHMNKTWVIFEEKNGKEEFKAIVPFTMENCDWEWNTVIDGVKIRRDQAMNYFCILPSEIDTGEFMPYLISFRRTSFTAGKKLYTAKEKAKMFGRPMCSNVFKLLCRKTENDKGAFYVYDVEKSRTTTPEELKAIKPWFDIITKSSVKVDNTDLEEEAADRSSNNFEASHAY